MMKYAQGLLFVLLVSFCGTGLAAPMGDTQWIALKQQVEQAREELNAAIARSKDTGAIADRAEVSLLVIDTFLKAAQQDRNHLADVKKKFESFGWHRKLNAAEVAEGLSEEELKDCLDVACHALSEIEQQKSGALELVPSTDFSKGAMVLKSGAYYLDGQPVFPYSLVWMPQSEEYMQQLGRMGGGYFQLSFLGKNGQVGDRRIKGDVKALEARAQLNAAPMVFLMGHAAAGWMLQQHPEIRIGGRHFTKYDIDSPLIRKWITQLCSQLIPEYSKACGDQPMMHLLANEPHFATQRGGWAVKNGLSNHTMKKYQDWLQNKYKTIDQLNEYYKTDHESFNQVSLGGDPLKRWIDPKLRGSAVWYDWCRFNMDRTNEWFTFLKEECQSNDGGRKAPVSIKVLGFSLSGSQRDGGMDMEYLTKLQDVMGADLRVAPRGAQFFGKHEEGLEPETGWQYFYAYDWVEQAMYLDFSKSLCPEKVFYDSEWHGFSAVSWRHFNMDREYVRSALWFAFTHGMGAIKPWVWGRNAEGALSGNGDFIGELCTQPVAVDAYGRTMKELNAHARELLALHQAERKYFIYYCEESAIQDRHYTEGMKQVYEAFKLLNLPVGFTTPSHIAELDAKGLTLVVPPTPYISEHSLKQLTSFQKSGGKLISFNPEKSFLKTELGVVRSKHPLEPNISLPMASVQKMLPSIGKITGTGLPKITITDKQGSPAYGVIIRMAEGGKIIAVNNVSKDLRVITFSARGPLTDLLTGRQMGPRIEFPSCGVLLVEMFDNVLPLKENR